MPALTFAPAFVRRCRLLAACCALLLPLGLASCADDEAEQNFPPLTYTYLSQLHLNVGRISIVDQSPPGTVPGDISANAPVPPQQALEEMARDRLIASGVEGSAAFTITRASILHEPGGTLQGDLSVQVSILTATGAPAGYAEAHVSRTMNPGDRDPESRAVLYDFTSQMMQDMNVELEYQIKKTLHDWLVDATGAPLDQTIQQQSLTSSTRDAAGSPPPDASPAGSSPTGSSPDGETAAPVSAMPEAAPAGTAKPAASALPDAVFPTGAPEAAPSQTVAHSPKPGTLALPASH
ncbi:hypothetical protein [Acidomonas methanolica]|uniref:hypothetical protein n=1 Tax=Acidomonas methanolica TaxID=437 RepID=UPI00211A29E8|nr:hypothetical protein [Acidomonas methanolica]MCQ9155298.1 hypothetical protein [Acidomonas methanolica]